MKPKLTYVEQGRSGTIVYRDEQGTVSFYFEFGGSNCVVIIFVPSPKEWTATTKRPLEARESILHFVAQQSIRDKAPTCHYAITDSSIDILLDIPEIPRNLSSTS